MKKNYSRLCSLALALCLSAASWAIDIVDGVYQIGSVADMQEFVQALIENEGQVDAVMTADIDMSEYPEFMLSTTEIPLLGTFDGQYHTLNVYQEQPTVGYVAPIRKLGGSAVLKNLIVTGTLVATGQHCAGLIGSIVDTGVVVENCVSKVDIITHVSGDGSHGGLLGGIGNSCAATISNSAFAGSIISPDMVTTQCGGICGWSDGDLVLNNVLLIAEFQLMDNDNDTWGSLTFVRNPTKAKLNNCYYLNPLTVVDADAKQITEEQIASGEACFLLNGSKSTDCTWFQNLSGDIDPTPVPNAAHGTVYMNGRLHCDGTAYEGSIFTNINAENVQDDHDFDEGICTYCHHADPTFLTPGEDGFYNLATAGELRWFAAMVNGGEVGISARLTEAIDLDGVDIASIGFKGKKFAGIFDGQLKPITNISKPLFGWVENAEIKNVALESGQVEGRDKDVCDQTGTLICRADNTTLTNSYSAASIVLGDEGDCGGLVGKMTGTIQHCFYTGTCASAGWSHAGIVGSDQGALEISDCFVAAELITTGGEAKGTIVGWSDGTIISNCVSIASADFNKVAGHQGAPAETNCVFMTAAEFEAGAATWFLNGNSFAAPTWFQNLDEGDATPKFDAERGVVYKITDEAFTNDVEEFKTGVTEEGELYVADLVAYTGDITAYTEALAVLKNAETQEALVAAYADVVAKRKAVEASAASYVKYQTRLEEIAAQVEATPGLVGPTMKALTDYLEENIAPCEQYPNGSSLYILANMTLDVAGIDAEIIFANQLLEAALKANYKKGDEITSLIVNPLFTAETRFEGWETKKNGSTLTTGSALAEEGADELSVKTTGEVWNATAEVKQTLVGLKNGVYEVRVNAATRPACNIFNANDNHIGYLFANDDETYVQALTEDMVNDETAIDGVNCHLTGTNPDHQLTMEDGVTYYVPYGPISAAYAFSGGRYENRVLTKVTDGTLTLGVRLDGSDLANDWMGFGNFRLFYLGTEEEAADAMGDGLDSYIARANTLINYEASIARPDPSDDKAFSYMNKPNYYNVLRAELQANIADAAAAVSTEDKLAVCARFTELFHQIYTCKHAYAKYVEFANLIYDASGVDESTTDEESAELADAVDEVFNGYIEGDFTQEEAEAMALIKNTAYFQRYAEGAPEYKDGWYQLSEPKHLAWLANQTNKLGLAVQAELVAPIDLTEVEYEPIGTMNSSFAGTFKGNLHPITGLKTMLFGRIDGGTLDGVVLKGSVITSGNTEYATQTGSLAGILNSGTVTRCYSDAQMLGGAGDIGGLFGKVNTPVVIKNCMFAGNVMAGWSAGGLIGSTDGNNEDVTISDILIDSRNITYKNGDGHGLLVGWLHDGNQQKISNIWVIEGSELTNMVGYNNDKAFVNAQTTKVTAEQAASGMVTWGLNRGEEVSPVWFQTLGEDLVPTLSPDSKIVYLYEGQYTNVDPTAVEEVKEELNNNEPQIVNVYDLNGRLLLRGVDSKTGLRSLPNGLYIIGGRKVLK